MSIFMASAPMTACARGAGVRTLLAFAAVLLLAVSPLLTRAESPPTLANFAGNYAYVGTRDQGHAIVDAAIDKNLADQSSEVRLFVKKGFAEYFADAIVIKTPPGKIGIKTGALPESFTDPGKSQTFKNDQGKWLKVKRQFDNGQLIETAVGETGTTVTVYELSADGKILHRNIAFRSDTLTKPITYTLDYKRK